MEREYDNVIFTNHALERLALRELTQAMVAKTIRQPDEKRLEEDGDTRFIKTIDGRSVHVVAKFDLEDKKWVAKTLWVRGEEDEDNVWAAQKPPTGARPTPQSARAPKSAPPSPKGQPTQANKPDAAQAASVIAAMVAVVRIVMGIVAFVAKAIRGGTPKK